MSKSIPGIDISVKKKLALAIQMKDQVILSQQVKTDSDGQFNLGILPPGEYFITVKIPDETDETAESIESILESANANAKTYTESKSNTASVAIYGASSEPWSLQ